MPNEDVRQRLERVAEILEVRPVFMGVNLLQFPVEYTALAGSVTPSSTVRPPSPMVEIAKYVLELEDHLTWLIHQVSEWK